MSKPTTAEQVKEHSHQVAVALGYTVNPDLPLIDYSSFTRDLDEFHDRLTAMYCLAACAHGFDRSHASEWYAREALSDKLTFSERQFMKTGHGPTHQYMAQIEGMWAMCWVIGVVDELDFGEPCSDDFVWMLPDLKSDAQTSDFRHSTRFRPIDEVLVACDLAYRLHWSIVSCRLQGAEEPGTIPAEAVIERRRALEWLFQEEDWDSISLDT